MDSNSLKEFTICPACSNNLLCLNGDDDRTSPSLAPTQVKPCGHVICDECACAGGLDTKNHGPRSRTTTNCPLSNCNRPIRTIKRRTDLVEVLKLTISTVELMTTYLESESNGTLAPFSAPTSPEKPGHDISSSTSSSTPSPEDFGIPVPETSEQVQSVLMSELATDFEDSVNLNYLAMAPSSQKSASSEDSEDIISLTPSTPKKMSNSQESGNLMGFELVAVSPGKHEDFEIISSPADVSVCLNDPSKKLDNVSQWLTLAATTKSASSEKTSNETVQKLLLSYAAPTSKESESESPLDLSLSVVLPLSEVPGPRRNHAFSHVDPSLALDLSLTSSFGNKSLVPIPSDPAPAPPRHAVFGFARHRQRPAHSLDLDRNLSVRNGTTNLEKSMDLSQSHVGRPTDLELEIQDLRKRNSEERSPPSVLENHFQQVQFQVDPKSPHQGDSSPRASSPELDMDSISCASSPPKASKPKPSQFIFCTSRLSKSQISKLEQLCLSTGAKIVSDFSPSITHLILNLEKGKVPQTMKYLFAIAAKKWILTFSWIEECLKKSAIVPEEPFETSNFENCDPGGRISRLTRKRLFQDFNFFVAESGDMVEDHKKILELLGARILENLPEIPGNKDIPCRLLIVGDISSPAKIAEFQNFFERGSWITVLWEWIHLCILDYKLYQFEPIHLITNLGQGNLLWESRLPRPIVKLYEQFSSHNF